MQSSKTLLSGGLYYTPQEWAKAEDREKCVFKVKSIQSREALWDTRWTLLRFVSGVALLDPQVETPPFVYPVFYRQSLRRALMLSHRRHIVDAFLKTVISFNRLAVLEAVYVDVQGLASLICCQPGAYAVTYLHARTSGLGSALRSLSFYGDDVTGSSLYREHSASLLAHTCGLRDVYADKRSRSEALRLSAEGSVSFYHSQREDLLAAEKALAFVSKRGFLLEPEGVGPRVRVSTEEDLQEEQL
jgi:hypothetical protein